MADIADALKTYLGKVQAITDIVGSRIYHNRARQARQLDYLVLEENAGEVIDLLRLDSGFAQTVFAVYHYGASRTRANNLATVVRQNLHTFNGDMEGVSVVEVAMPQYRSTRQIQLNLNADEFFFETLQLYDIWHYVPKAVVPV